jgi:S-adenosylmethionine decarboxylase
VLLANSLFYRLKNAIEDRALFYEGSEKKAEIIIKSASFSLLRDIRATFWPEFVQCCNAQILSTVENADCKAFLLSESSLFVWHDRLLILTCGITRLVHSVQFFLNEIGIEHVNHVIYQRKNEYFAHEQVSSFNDDVNILTQYMAGKAFRFGELDSHHNHIFHMANQFQASPTDQTYEVLAYQICTQASQQLTCANLNAADIRKFLCLDALVPDFILDDHVFKPYGYSLNAIKEQLYLTIHITPQAGSSYVSVEANFNLLEKLPLLIEILQPASFDLLSYNEAAFEQQLNTNIPLHYVSKSKVTQLFNSGYQVCFASFIKPQTHFSPATELNISGVNDAF